MSDATSTSPELIQLIRNHDPNAWGRFVDSYAPDIYRWCRKLGVSSVDSADIVQLVLVDVFKGIEKYQTSKKGSFRGWLWTVTRNATASFFRKKNRQIEGDGGTSFNDRLRQVADPVSEGLDYESVTGTFCNEPSIDTMLVKWNDVMSIVKSEFNQNQKTVFELTLVQGLNASEAAGQCTLSAANIRQIKFRILKRLRKLLGEQPQSVV